MKNPRGGRTAKIATLRTSAHWAGGREAWLFHGEPKNPHVSGSKDFYSWESNEAKVAWDAFSHSGLKNRLGHDIPEAAWCKAKETIFWFVANRELHNTSHANSDKNDSDSFGATKEKWSRQLSRMERELEAILNNEISKDIWKRYRRGNEPLIPSKNRLHSKLNGILKKLMDVAAIVERAEPLKIELPHPAELRKDAGRRLKEIATKYKLPASGFVKAFNIYIDVGSEGGFSEWFQSLNETE